MHACDCFGYQATRRCLINSCRSQSQQSLNEMAVDPSERDLLEAVRKSLSEVGTIGHFKAELRASVMSILNKNSNHTTPTTIPDETRVINELIREYLSWNGYIYSEQILVAESGDTGGKVRRESLATKLGVMDDNKTQKIPLLYYIMSAFKNQEP